jgi:hypothetical protein
MACGSLLAAVVLLALKVRDGEELARTAPAAASGAR